MSRTWKDMQAIQIATAMKRKQALERTYREAIAREKARNEVLLAMSAGTLKAKQVSGPIYLGKVGDMQRSVRFNIEALISLRAKQLAS